MHPSLSNAQPVNNDIIIRHGTTILTLVSPDTIWIAADSKVAEVTSYNSTTGNSLSQNKIFETNGIIYGFAAILKCSNKSGMSLFDSQKIMDSIIKDRKQFQSSAIAYKDAILVKLTELLDSLVLKESHAFIDKYMNEPIHTFLMASFGNEGPKYYSQSYIIAKNGNAYKIQEMQPSIYDYGTMYFMTGSKKAIKEFLNLHPDYFGDFHEMKKKLICLISLEAKKNLADVGMPVDVVELYRNDFKWFLDNKECDLTKKIK